MLLSISGKKAVVARRSRIVDASSAIIGSERIDATVTIAHSRTQDIAEIVER